MGKYLTQKVCLNGHQISSSVDINASHSDNEYCEKCGSKVICKCPSCNEMIKGKYDVEGFAIIGSKIPVPNYCPFCATPYPWTQSLIENAVAIVALDRQLSKNDAEVIRHAIPYLVSETSMSELEALKVRDIVTRASKPFCGALKKLLSDIVSNAIVQIIFSQL